MAAHDSFWNWFIQHEVELFEFDPNQETERELLFDRLATEINKVHPDLAFEFGPQGPMKVPHHFSGGEGCKKGSASQERFIIGAFV